VIDAQTMMNDVAAIREKAPLVLSITNYVVTNTTANALLAIGASPAMSHAVAEMEDLTSISGALVINLGGLTDEYRHAMLTAGKVANEKSVPIVFDPVALGASRLRNETAAELMNNIRPSSIRGNASEIMALAGSEAAGKGVDSLHGTEQALPAAKELAGRFGCSVCASGEIDVITDGERVARIHNGHALMPRVTGLGCTATAIIGAFMAVNPDHFQATCHAMGAMGVAGELAADRSNGPGSLQMNLYDMLYRLNRDDFAGRLKLEVAR
jgi:hydroxyethylthiazole kinase